MTNSNLVAVVGLGKTGMSCVRYLVAKGFDVAVTDSRTIPPCIQELRSQFPKVPVLVDGINETLLSEAGMLVVSPGISIQEPAILKQTQRGIPIIGDIELFAKAAKAPQVVITGSNGKSTVTTLVGEMATTAGMTVRVGGNLGTPALELIQSEEPDLYVLELSSFQLETTYSLQAAVAVNLNVSPDHLDRYNTYQDYIVAKQRIYKGCTVAIINRDDPASYANAVLPQKTISFGVSDPKAGEYGLRQHQDQYYLACGAENLLAVDEILMKGRHQQLNALAALALGTSVNIPMSAMLQTLKQFKGLAHRCQWVATINEVEWYNDSKATNVGAAIAALEGLGSQSRGKLILIAGGLGKHADFSSLKPIITQYVRHAILIGKDGVQLAKAIQPEVPVTFANDMFAAARLAKQQALPGDVVLLAPACASFDMFRNFEHRGEVFMNAVKSLQHVAV